MNIAITMRRTRSFNCDVAKFTSRTEWETNKQAVAVSL